MKHYRNSPPPPRLFARLTLLAAVLVALTVTTPAMAQVDWVTAFDGKAHQQASCPSGITRTVGIPWFEISNLTTTTADAVISGSIWTNLIQRSGAPTDATSLSVNYQYLQEGGIGGVGVLATVTNGGEFSGTTVNLTDLKPGKRHWIRLYVTVNGKAYGIAYECFRTDFNETNFNRTLGHYGDIDHSDWAGGCYAFGGDRDAITACLCGARNRNDVWKRTGTLEPNGQAIDSRQTSDTIYKWIKPAAWRTSQGCTSS